VEHEQSPRVRHARSLFAGIAPQYDRMGVFLSFGLDPRWRRFLVSKIGVPPGSTVLDVASGTGLVARELARRRLHVVRLDPSAPMLHAGAAADEAAGLVAPLPAVLGRAEELPFPDGAFDALTFTYLLRYVDDPEATMRELARVVRPGGTVAGLEFGVPEEAWAKAGWLAYTRLAMPAIGAAVSPAWRHTGRFLGPSVSEFWERAPLPEQVRWWQQAGLRHVRSRVLSLGVAVVMWAVKGGPHVP
jgi:demethylmenaquinone methyltransferase / 2-methoxy-6-polyprenyl-1,4-benzoquinol methylase